MNNASYSIWTNNEPPVNAAAVRIPDSSRQTVTPGPSTTRKLTRYLLPARLLLVGGLC